MNDATLDASRQKALSGVFAQHPKVQAVYLFGSAAAGTARPQSDLDLTVYRRDARDPAGSLKMDLLTELVHRGIDRVDLIF